jgi:hypothetical protein
VAPSFAMQFFQFHHFFILYFFHVFKDELKATLMVWCSYNDCVTQKYVVEMRRLACDETVFL